MKFKKVISFVLVFIILFTTLGTCNARTSNIYLCSDGTSHKFDLTVTTDTDRSDTRHIEIWERNITLNSSSIKLITYENNEKPFNVEIMCWSWIIHSYRTDNKVHIGYEWANLYDKELLKIPPYCDVVVTTYDNILKITPYTK